MTVYTVALNAGGFTYNTYNTFAAAIREMWVEFIIVFLRVFFLITQAVRQLAAAYVSSEKNLLLLSTVITQSFTVLMMRLLITLIATFLHNGFTGA